MENIDYNTFNVLKERMKAKFAILLEGYLQDAHGYIEAIDAALPNNDITAIIEAAHTFKSSSGLLGLMVVHKNAETLEYAAKDLQEQGSTDSSSLAAMSDALKTAFSDIEEILQQELQAASA